eukprot:gene8782-18160_t
MSWLKKTDVLIVGAGHNGLAAAVFLARKGLKVTVLEEKSQVGGATKTEYPFAKAPRLGTSTGSYLLGVMPPEILQKLNAKVRLIRRDPHYFLPTIDGRYLLFGSDKKAMQSQFEKFFSTNDWYANEALTTEIGQIRDDLAPSWLQAPISAEDTAERYIRTSLQKTFLDLVTKPVEDYLLRFGFKSDLLLSMYAVTDGFSGLTGSFGTQGTGMNFLVHNMCRLPGSDGSWMVVESGMGSISKEFARLAMEAGVTIATNVTVDKVLTNNNIVEGVQTTDGRTILSKVVLCNSDPFRLRDLVGQENFPADFNAKFDVWKRHGTTMKVNMALKTLPTFSCLPENRGQHNGTIHLLPPESECPEGILQHIKKGFEGVQRGQLSPCPTIEWYIHTQADPSLQDPEGRHNSAFFVQWVPYQLEGGMSWDDEEDAYVKKLFAIAERFAPGFTESVVEYSALTPPKIEKHFGISFGHIHHIDNTFGFDRRMPYATPVEGLYSCSAGCHPAGSVIGAAGHNAAHAILKDLGN